jgi:hypothetical protein
MKRLLKSIQKQRPHRTSTTSRSSHTVQNPTNHPKSAVSIDHNHIHHHVDDADVEDDDDLLYHTNPDEDPSMNHHKTSASLLPPPETNVVAEMERYYSNNSSTTKKKHYPPPKLTPSPISSHLNMPPSNSTTTATTTISSTDETRDLVKQFIADIWNRGALDMIPIICSPSIRFNGNTGTYFFFSVLSLLSLSLSHVHTFHFLTQ